jgi:hypothetical protein
LDWKDNFLAVPTFVIIAVTPFSMSIFSGILASSASYIGLMCLEGIFQTELAKKCCNFGVVDDMQLHKADTENCPLTAVGLQDAGKSSTINFYDCYNDGGDSLPDLLKT